MSTIKRYEPAMFQFPEGMKEGMAERAEGNYVMYADIAPLEAKVAMFPELLTALVTLSKIMPLTGPYADLLTRARAVEG